MAVCCCPYAVVEPDELAAWEWMGHFKNILGPGLQFIYPGSVIRKISTRVTENKVVTETKTKDNVFVHIHIAVQQEVHAEFAFQAIYKLNSPEQQIESFVADVVRSHVPMMTLDRLFEAKEEIAMEVKQRVASAMKDYGYLIHQVLVVDIVPDQAVKTAMNAINANKRLRQAAEEKAEADKMVVVKAAEAEAERKQLQGQGTARSRAAIIEGLKKSVGGGENISSKEITDLLLMTQYLDTLEKLSMGNNTTVFMPHSPAGLAQVAKEIRSGVFGVQV